MSELQEDNTFKPGMRVIKNPEFTRLLNELARYSKPVMGDGLTTSVDDMPEGFIIHAQPTIVRNDPAAAATGVWVRIKSNATGGGFYNSALVTGALGVDGTSDLTMPEGGSEGSAAQVLVANCDEDGNISTTHWLKLDSFAFGFIVGSTVETTARPLVVVVKGRPRVASPTALAATGERFTASTKSWNRRRATAGDALGDGPITIPLTTIPFYDDSTSSPILGAMQLVVTIAADGTVESISAESAVTIDIPVPCESLPAFGF